MKSLFLFLLLGILLLTRIFLYSQSLHLYQDNQTFQETYSFMHEPKTNSYGQYFFVKNVLVTVPLFPKYHYADKVILEGRVTANKNLKGSFLVVKNPKVLYIKDTGILLAVSRFIRQKIEDAVLTTIPAKEGGLMLGIILGVRDKIDSTFYQQLRNAGVLHIIAASGENVSIVASLLIILFSRIVKRRLALLFTCLGILFYALLAGFDPPIIRASVMALITFGALFLGRQSSGLYALLLTAWGMIFVNPQMATDVSFHLSFLSTFGILIIKPLIDNISGLRFMALIKDDITTTLAAQIATFPVMLSAFGSYSLLTFPINVALLWTVPIIMIFGGIGAIFSLTAPFLSVPFIFLSYPFLSYFTFSYF